jgi:hypothetical protein
MPVFDISVSRGLAMTGGLWSNLSVKANRRRGDQPSFALIHIAGASS